MATDCIACFHSFSCFSLPVLLFRLFFIFSNLRQCFLFAYWFTRNQGGAGRKEIVLTSALLTVSVLTSQSQYIFLFGGRGWRPAKSFFQIFIAVCLQWRWVRLEVSISYKKRERPRTLSLFWGMSHHDPCQEMARLFNITNESVLMQVPMKERTTTVQQRFWMQCLSEDEVWQDCDVSNLHVPGELRRRVNLQMWGELRGQLASFHDFGSRHRDWNGKNPRTCATTRQ